MFTENDLRELLDFKTDSPVLSVYLNTDPTLGSADAYRPRLRGMLKDIGLDDDFRKQLFEAVVFVLGYLYPEYAFIAHIYDGANHLHIQHGKGNILNVDNLTGDNDNVIIK